jgi:hypothetical protein
LIAIVVPYFDFKACELLEGAPAEAVEALKRLREIGKEEMDPNNI